VAFTRRQARPPEPEMIPENQTWSEMMKTKSKGGRTKMKNKPKVELRNN
jgi:hypothetical protein